MHRLQFIFLIGFLIILPIHKFLVTSSNSTTSIRKAQTKHGATILKTPAKAWAHVFLERKKRYLLFEKGASFVLTLNIGKNIISGRPRGLVQVNEISVYYDLPYSLEELLPKGPKRPSHPMRTKPTTRVSTTTTPIYSWLPENYQFREENQRFHRNLEVWEQMKGWTMKTGNMTSPFGPHSWRPNSNRQKQQSSRKLSRFRHQESTKRRKQSSTLFLDIIEHWALL